LGKGKSEKRRRSEEGGKFYFEERMGLSDPKGFLDYQSF